MNRFLYSVFAISVMLNLYLLLSSLPGRSELIEFWKDQALKWRERYFELINMMEHETKNKLETWAERIARYKKEFKEPDSENGNSDNITG